MELLSFVANLRVTEETPQAFICFAARFLLLILSILASMLVGPGQGLEM